jgi:hypothetical protein
MLPPANLFPSMIQVPDLEVRNPNQRAIKNKANSN